VRKLGTKQISAIRGGLDLLPWSGPLFLLAVFALGAMPPFGLFRSEFEIVAGGLSSGSYVPAAILIIAVTAAFFGLAASVTRMLMLPLPRPAAPVPDRVPVAARSRAEGPRSAQPGTDLVTPAIPPALTRGEPSAWMVVPVAAGAVALLWLGLHPPAVLDELFARAVALLGGGAS
jgi:hydrogenase-4 component F